MANPKAEKIWAEAVHRAVKRRLENEEGKPQKIERLADKLVDYAMEGNGWAFKEIGERLDGRAPQAVDVTTDGKPIPFQALALAPLEPHDQDNPSDD